jgi:HK97 family phage portal protein
MALVRKGRRLDEILDDMEDRQGWSGVPVGELTALKVGAAQACVSLIANDVACLPVTVRRRGAFEADAPGMEAARVLWRSPNPWQTQFEFRQMMTAQALLRGDAFAYKVFAGDGSVAELWPLMKSEVTVNRIRGEIEYVVHAYDGRIAGSYGRQRIMHLRGLTMDGRAGLDRVFLARDALGLAAAAERAQGAVYKNSNRMPGYYSTDEGLTDDEVDRLAAELQRATTGMNQGRSPLFDRGLKYHAVGQSMRDAEMVETRRHQIVEVCAAFNVVPAVLGLDDKTQAFASVEAMMRWHLQHTLRPWLTAWEQVADKDILDGLDMPLELKFDTSEIERASLKDQSDAFAGLIDRGVMTRNEARARMGLVRLDGLDTPLTPMNLQQGAEDE